MFAWKSIKYKYKKGATKVQLRFSSNFLFFDLEKTAGTVRKENKTFCATNLPGMQAENQGRGFPFYVCLPSTSCLEQVRRPQLSSSSSCLERTYVAEW